ncbi:MAG TPA: hypothetical protein VK013_18860 [Myxococcaceae bacterium]|nr:hypothetical protein [Myxococcaceae bacterium]
MIDNIKRVVRPVVDFVKPAAEAAVDVVKDVTARVTGQNKDAFEAARPAGPTPLPRFGTISEKQAQAYAALPPEDQQRYNRVFESISGDPRSRAAMRTLLTAGSLTSHATGGQGGTLLQHLETLGLASKLKDGIDPAQLQQQLVQDLAFPERISQGADNVICGATAALTDLAFARPAEYARLTTEMATRGEVSLGRGSKDDLSLKLRKLSDENANDRSLTQRLLAVPLLEAAVSEGKVGEDGEVITREGGFNVFGWNLFGRKEVRHGTVSDEMEAMKAALTRGRADDEAFESLYLGGAPAESQAAPVTTDRVLGVIEEQLANRASPAIKVLGENGEEAHWVTVTGVDDDQLIIADGRGRRQRVNAEEFLGRADALTYDVNVGDTRERVRGAATSGEERAGGGGKLSTGSGSIEDMGRRR